MELVEKYSEQTYSRRVDLLKELDHSIADTVWNEVLRYRRQFCYELHIMDRTYHITMCRSVLFRILECEEKLLKQGNIMRGLSDCLQHEERTNWQLLLHHKECGVDVGDAVWIQHACELLEITQCTFIMEVLLLQVPVVIQLFLCMHLPYTQREPALFLIALVHDALYLMDILFPPYVDECGYTGEEEDLTYDLLDFLKNLELKISDRMLLLKGGKQNQQQFVSLRDLKERYPMLQEEQLRFYVGHRDAAHYYTIQQYIAYCGVCYETARTALDQLVNLNWYQKRKIGKKFVYFIQ